MWISCCFCVLWSCCFVIICQPIRWRIVGRTMFTVHVCLVTHYHSWFFVLLLLWWNAGFQNEAQGAEGVVIGAAELKVCYELCRRITKTCTVNPPWLLYLWLHMLGQKVAHFVFVGQSPCGSRVCVVSQNRPTPFPGWMSLGGD